MHNRHHPTAFDEYVKAAGVTSAKSFTKAMWDDSSLNGVLYAVPGGADWIVYFWNKDMYRPVRRRPGNAA